MERVRIVVLVVLLGFFAVQLVQGRTPGRRKAGNIIGGVYLLGLLYFTLFSREPSGDNRVNFVLFYSIYRALRYPVRPNEVIGAILSGQYETVFTTVKPLETAFLNIMLFIPMGYILPMYLAPERGRFRRVLAVCGLSSLCIEIIQALTSLGWFDMDDLFCNVLGGVIGYTFASVAGHVRHSWRKEDEG